MAWWLSDDDHFPITWGKIRLVLPPFHGETPIYQAQDVTQLESRDANIPEGGLSM